ncbi:MAG: hypothetical protein KA801_06785 [Syntrophorhabdaceae bacterium]|nr:hypothetical protein [Syntrophorhabdaceae bacterium]
MPIERIIYFVESYFNQRDFERFGVQILIDNDFDVEVWDFTPFVAPSEYRKVTQPPSFECKNWFLFDSEKEALASISNLDHSCFVISLFHYTPATISIYRLLSKLNIQYCVDACAIPVGPVSIGTRIKWKRPRDIVARAFYSLPYWIMGIKPADMVLARGEKYGTSGYAVDEKSEILWVHHYDYDNYLRDRNGSSTCKNTVVFLDEYLPFHPDFAYSGYAVPVTPEEYYPKLCEFFDYLESRRGLKTIIAAHPRSHYEDHPDFFHGRPVVRGKTSELVRDSSLVVLHMSFSMNYAVLYRKPMTFITTDKYNQGWTELTTSDWLSRFFGKKSHNLDYPLELDMQQEMSVDEQAYEKYQNAYIKKKGTPDFLSFQILANRLREIL